MENYNRICKSDFSIQYYLNDNLHRLDGPAVIQNNGTKYFLVNNKLHRTNGPAIEYENGYKEWYYEGKLHRLNGPAIDNLYNKKFYIYGIQYLEHEYYNKIHNMKFRKFKSKNYIY
jgi:hypothetical protein